MTVNWGFNPFDIIGAVGSIVNTRQINKTNLQIARETNQANREMVEMQNQAAREEAEKAYKRSSAPNQVAQMMSAGMSRAGAINALNGGGSYTPAPVNVSQDSAPQMQTTDLSALSNVMQIQSQKATEKHQEKLQREQLAAQKEENAANRENAKEIATIQANASKYGADQTAGTARERLDWEKKQFEVLSPYQIRYIEAQIKQINADVNMTELQTEDLQYKYAEYVSNRSMRDAVTLFQELESVYNYHVTQQDFNDFKRSYMYYDDDTDSYQYITHTKALTKVEAHVTQFWDVIAKILPANKIGKIVQVALGK